MTVVNMLEAKTQLSKLVARAEAGEDVVIARDGRPAVRLTPVPRGGAPNGARLLGLLAGQFSVPDDFDEPVPGFEAAFYDDEA